MNKYKYVNAEVELSRVESSGIELSCDGRV